MTKTIIFTLFVVWFQCYLFGQGDPILFAVNGKNVHLSEFEYIYSKNNGANADYSEESLKEYLELYVNFKLKVEKARAKKIDTLSSYIEELAGYRRQLADSYIVNKELSNRLAREAFERMQKDVAFSHILINLDEKASVQKQNDAREKIERAQTELKKGEKFEDVVLAYSEDQRSMERQGAVGYMTALFPDGYYKLETALYTTSKGKYSDVIRTKLGYHIIRVDDIRDARGRMTVAHLLIRKKNKGVENPDAENEISEIYKQIKNGASFEKLVAEKSEDNNTKKLGGRLSEYGIGQFEKSFEDAAFGLKRNGDVSKPVETRIGFHVIKRLGLRKADNFDQIKNDLVKNMKRGDRYEAGKKAINEEIKTEAGYRLYEDALKTFIDSLDQSFYQYNWVIPDYQERTLCELGNEKYSLSDFTKFCKKRGRMRMQNNSSTPFPEAVEILLEEYVSEKAIDYQQSQLEEKYSDFRNLMREYEEGILLFEITKEEVWDKASNDKEGIESYYEQNKNEYVWNERAKVVEYAIRSTDMSQVSKILKKAMKNKAEVVATAFNDPDAKLELVMYTDKIVEKDQDEIKEMPWKKGGITAPKINNGLKMTTFKKIERIMPSSPKSLDDARGYVISDYQSYLEKQWILALKKEYKVVLDEKVLETVIKR